MNMNASKNDYHEISILNSCSFQRVTYTSRCSYIAFSVRRFDDTDAYATISVAKYARLLPHRNMRLAGA